MWANSDTVAVEFEFEWMQNIVTNKELIVTNKELVHVAIPSLSLNLND
jgi:hypothetical protein